MTNIEFKSLRVFETENHDYEMSVVQRKTSDLPTGDMLVRVDYSSLNYKDALSCYGNRGVTREYPHTPGIDAVGTVIESGNENFAPGLKVIVTGFDLGMNTDGGLSEFIRIPSEWAVPLPAQMSEKDAMIYGTAGFTAALSVYELIQAGIQPESGPILVTGANGGVGNVAITLLSKLGYSVTAATGRLEETENLIAKGAAEVIHRSEVDDTTNKALLKGRWAGVIDTVGGNMLATAVKSTLYNGCVTCCGNVASAELNTTVYPFILRGIRLIGIDSGRVPFEKREEVWKLLANEWKPDSLGKLAQEISLEEAPDIIADIYQKKHKGRTVVKLG